MSETLFYILKDSCFDIEDLDVTKGNVYDLIFCRATAKENGKILVVAAVIIFAGKKPKQLPNVNFMLYFLEYVSHSITIFRTGEIGI